MATSARYSCDCGSLAIGSGDCRVLVGNCEGDGDYTVTVYQSKDEFRPVEAEGGWTFQTVCEGQAVTVYGYDCTWPEDDPVCGLIPLFTLTGRFAVYAKNGDMALVRWS